MKYRVLKPKLIIQTQQRLAQRIAQRFPGSGLSEVANELLTLAENAADRAEEIRRPNMILRGIVALLLLGAVALIFRVALSVELRANLHEAMNLVQFVEAALGASVFLGAAAIFLISLEFRRKRKRALAALHELRAMAHVIDMHQLAKDPEGILRRRPAVSEEREQTTKTLFELNRYLNYCNELLAIISKVAALYVQQFPDGPTVSAVDQVEDLCSGLSHKIWQKIMILNQVFCERPLERSALVAAETATDEPMNE